MHHPNCNNRTVAKTGWSFCFAKSDSSLYWGLQSPKRMQRQQADSVAPANVTSDDLTVHGELLKNGENKSKRGQEIEPAFHCSLIKMMIFHTQSNNNNNS